MTKTHIQPWTIKQEYDGYKQSLFEISNTEDFKRMNIRVNKRSESLKNNGIKKMYKPHLHNNNMPNAIKNVKPCYRLFFVKMFNHVIYTSTLLLFRQRGKLNP